MSNVPPPPPPSGDPGPVGPPPAPGGPPPSGGYVPQGPAPVGAGTASFLSPRWGVTDPPPAGWQPKQKMVAGLLAILLGGFGVHAFYLGNTKKGIIYLLITVLSCFLLAIVPSILAIIEGINILTGKEPTDAYGVPLTE